MGWVCGTCSTNNDDDQSSCFVCGASRAKALPSTPAAPRTADRPATSSAPKRSSTASSSTRSTSSTSHSSSYSPSYSGSSSYLSGYSGSSSRSSSSSRSTATRSRSVRHSYGRYKIVSTPAKVFAVLVIILSFIVGQVLVLTYYSKTGNVFLLTKLVRYFNSPDLTVTDFIGVGCVIGVLSTIIFSYLTLHFLNDLKRGKACLAIIPFCITAIINPVLSAPFTFVFGLLFLIIKKTGVCAVFQGIFIAFLTVWFILLAAGWAILPDKFVITFDMQGGYDGTDSVMIMLGEDMPFAEAPIRDGYVFDGYYDSPEGGTQYYSADMESLYTWDIEQDITLYARWIANGYVYDYSTSSI